MVSVCIHSQLSGVMQYGHKVFEALNCVERQKLTKLIIN